MLALIDKSRLSSTLSYEFIISTLHSTKTQQLRSTPPRQENEEYKPLTQIEQRVVALSLQSFTTRQIAEKLKVFRCLVWAMEFFVMMDVAERDSTIGGLQVGFVGL